LKLKEKTYKKFVEFFTKTSRRHGDNEFEIAYSEIQRDTGVASITLKKGIQILADDGVISVSQGRNTRYGKFKLLLNNRVNTNRETDLSINDKDMSSSDEDTISLMKNQQKNINVVIEQLRLRIRTQEMTISVILDRLAELEDRIKN